MLEAKAERQRRRGEAPIDVEAETTRLLAPADEAPGPAPARTPSCGPRCASWSSPATNGGCARALDPLDVEAETERQLEDLVGSP